MISFILGDKLVSEKDQVEKDYFYSRDADQIYSGSEMALWTRLEESAPKVTMGILRIHYTAL